MPDDTGQIYSQAEQFKAALLKRERNAASQMIRVYGQAWTRLSKLLIQVTEKIGEAQRRGDYMSPAWLYQQERYARLMTQVEREMAKFVAVADDAIKREQSAAVKAALRDSAAIAKTAANVAGVDVSFTQINPSAVESIAGFLSNGAPLRRLLDEIPRGAGLAVADALTEGVALGFNPTKIARNVKHAMGMNLTRALTIARTETLRAYREAAHENFKANDDVLQGWIWTASLSRRTCPSCIAMHGTFHPMSERMESHPRCRCVQLPLLKGQTPPLEKGDEWFAKQNEETQRAILVNKATFKAYQEGKLKLTDLVGRKSDVNWGNTYHHLSLKRALNGEGKFPGYNWPGQGAPIAGSLPVKVVPISQPLAFVPAKTIKEAEEWAVAQGIAKSVTYQGLRLEDVNRVNQSLGQIWQDWRLGSMDRISNTKTGRAHAGANGSRLEWNPILGSAEEIERVLNSSVRDFPDMWALRMARYEEAARKDPTQFGPAVAKAREAMKYNRWLAKTDNLDAFVEETFIHEAGHVLSDRLLGMIAKHRLQDPAQMVKGSQAEKLLDEWGRIYATRGSDVYKISQYADVDQDEFFAETFVMYNKERNKLPAHIVNYFDRLKKYANERPLPKL